MSKSTTWKVSRYGAFSGTYFPAFGLNTDQKKLLIWKLFTQSLQASYEIIIHNLWLIGLLSSKQQYKFLLELPKIFENLLMQQQKMKLALNWHKYNTKMQCCLQIISLLVSSKKAYFVPLLSTQCLC